MTSHPPKPVSRPHWNPEELQLSFAGRIVQHLGVQMYAGRPVPAIAELISNAWDADASEVRISLPVGVAWDSTNAEHIIEIVDDGHGMSWELVRDGYLDVGRDKRVAGGTDRSPRGRPLQGRKGIGKLAGFGIADVIEIQTVHKDPDPRIGEQTLIWIQLSLRELQMVEKGPARARVVYVGPASRAPEGGRRTTGTTVTLRQLHNRRSINADRFRASLARRFILAGTGLATYVNGTALGDESIPLQMRWPAVGWQEDEVPGCGPVMYWIGSTEKPRKQDAGDLAGILVYTRGKVSQEETSFEISGGVTGQHGLRYLCGMVRVEWLDEGVVGRDLIATHRGSISWESPEGKAFQEWGQGLVKRYLAEWAKHRSRLRKRHVEELDPRIKRRIDSLNPAYREVAYEFVEKFQTVEMDPEEFASIFSWFLDALENATLRGIFEQLREADQADLIKLDELLDKLKVRTAVSLLEIINGNLAAIDTLERMHLEDAKERGVISKHLEENPWLINPTWMLNQPEARVATWIRKEFKLPEVGDKDDDRRVDFFCVGVGGVLHIVEIKRGGHVATDDDFLQAERYREYVWRRFDEIKDPEGIKYQIVQAHLIAARLHKNAKGANEVFYQAGRVIFTTWSDLVARAKRAHNQYKEVLAVAAASE